MTADLTGDTKLLRQIKRLEQRAVRRVSRRAFGKALTVLMNRIADQAPSAHIGKAIGRKLSRVSASQQEFAGKVGYHVGKRRSRGAGRIKSGGRRGKEWSAGGMYKNSAPHAHLIELGTQERFTKTGASRGVMPAKPWLARARLSADPIALAKFDAEFINGIKHEVSKQ